VRARGDPPLRRWIELVWRFGNCEGVATVDRFAEVVSAPIGVDSQAGLGTPEIGAIEAPSRAQKADRERPSAPRGRGVTMDAMVAAPSAPRQTATEPNELGAAVALIGRHLPGYLSMGARQGLARGACADFKQLPLRATVRTVQVSRHQSQREATWRESNTKQPSAFECKLRTSRPNRAWQSMVRSYLPLNVSVSFTQEGR